MRRRGKHLMLGVLDWSLMENWQQKEIPLKIVLNGINNVFDNVLASAKEPAKIKSLSFCKEEVETLFSEWRALQIGKNSDEKSGTEAHQVDTELKVEDRLRQIAAEFTKACIGKDEELARSFNAVVNQLNALCEETHSREEVIVRLEELESELGKEIVNSADSNLKMKVELETKKQIEALGANLDPNAYASAFQKMLLKNFRNELGVPRLSYYNL